MYSLKPLVNFTHVVDFTPTMYGLKNIYMSSNNSSPLRPDRLEETRPNILEQASMSEVEQLKERQDEILKQLNLLKEQMLSLRIELNTGAIKKEPEVESNKELNDPLSYSRPSSNKQCWNGALGEIVISASPDNPPYSLLAINQLWPRVLQLHVICHIHSSVVSLPSHLSCFSSLSLTASPNLQARVIWTNMGPDCEFVFSPLSQCPIRGEVNFLRFLHRFINGIDDPAAYTQLDHTLDVCHRLVHAQTQRDKQINVRLLNTLLGRSPWFGGLSMSVADVAAWSIIKKTSGIELSQNMARWNDQCNQAFA